MKFSKRTNWTLETNRLSALREQLAGQEETVIDLSVSNPTVCGFSSLQKAVFADRDAAQTRRYQPQARGLLSARETIAEYYRLQGRDVSAEQIFLTASTSEAYTYLFRLLADPGDTVLVPRPSYPLFDFLTGLSDVDARGYHLVHQGRWTLTEHQLNAQADPSLKALLVVNPNNPTGSYVSGEEVKLLNAFCARHQSALIVDEVFFDYPVGLTAERHSFAGNRPVLTFVLNGLSKTLALPQMKLSWIVLSGPEDLVREAGQRLEVIADTFLSVNTPVQHALSALFARREEIQKEVRARVNENLASLQEASLADGRLECLDTEGGWSAVVRLPPGTDEEEFVVGLLEQEKVLVHPGYFFDFEDQPYIVVSLLPQRDLFEQGLSRLFKRL